MKGMNLPGNTSHFKIEGLSDMLHFSNGRDFPKTIGRCIHHACCTFAIWEQKWLKSKNVVEKFV